MQLTDWRGQGQTEAQLRIEPVATIGLIAHARKSDVLMSEALTGAPVRVEVDAVPIANWQQQGAQHEHLHFFCMISNDAVHQFETASDIESLRRRRLSSAMCSNVWSVRWRKLWHSLLLSGVSLVRHEEPRLLPVPSARPERAQLMGRDMADLFRRCAHTILRSAHDIAAGVRNTLLRSDRTGYFK